MCLPAARIQQGGKISIERMGWLEGMEEGRAEEKNNIARKMQDNGLSIEQIALIIGLTEKEIKEL